MVPDHIELIDSLGGPKCPSDSLRRRSRVHITPQAISLWKRRGVAWKHRQVIAEMARENGLPLPHNFTII
jgi:hypothetical protein